MAAIVNAVMNLGVPYNTGSLFAGCGSVRF